MRLIEITKVNGLAGANGPCLCEMLILQEMNKKGIWEPFLIVLSLFHESKNFSKVTILQMGAEAATPSTFTYMFTSRNH